MRASVLHWVLIFCCVYTRVSSTSFGVLPATGSVAPPIRVENETAWVSRVTLTQTSDSIVLVLLKHVGYSGYEPCTEFSPVCCLGLQLRDTVWGGDVAVLDNVRRSCRVQGGEPWATVLAPLKSRNYSDIQFTLDDVFDPWRGVQTTDGLYSVHVLVLVLKRWSGCEVVGADACLLHLQAIEQTFKVDTRRTQQSTTVSIPTRCTHDKPEHALWFPSVTTCEWFCEPGFTRCHWNHTDSCQALPEVGTALYTTIAVTWFSGGYLRDVLDTSLLNQMPNTEPFDIDGAFDVLSTAIATRMTAAGIFGVHGCSVIFHETGSEVGVGTPVVTLSGVDEIVRTDQGLYYNGVGLQATPTQHAHTSSNIPVDLTDVDNRLTPGYSEFTVLVYSNDTTVPLTHQALLLRYVIIDTLIEDSRVESVLYVRDVRGIMRGGDVTHTAEISVGEIIGLLLWAMSLFAVIMTALLCPHLYPQNTNTEMPVGGDAKESLKNTTVCCTQSHAEHCCTQHSPRDRTLIAVLLVLIVSTLLGSFMIYAFVVIPQLQSSAIDDNEHPLLTLGWLWGVFVITTLLVMGYCFAAAAIRRLK
jgi:hypothetical protein